MEGAEQTELTPSNWVDEHGDALYRYALAMVKDRQTAEEIVQDTFLAGLESLEKYRGQSDPRGWLFGILRHKIHDHFRRIMRQQKQTEALDDNLDAQLFDAQGAWINPPAPWPRDPHAILKDQLFRRALKLCLDRLPEAQRSALLLRAFEEMPPQEICKQLGISTTYLWVLVHRARNGTRQCLEREWLRPAER